jgi:polyribonucleotide nucleotidyltransferase
MKEPVSVSITIGDKILTLESGLYAPQAAGAATVRQNDTIILATVCASEKPREGIDYFPLQVEYRERFSAAGKFPGGFFKREGRPSENEILAARFTDRPIRPLFAESYRNDVQVVGTLLSSDGDTSADILAILGASTALTLSELPFMGPIGGVRVGRINGKFIANPTVTERAQSDLDLVYAGNRNTPTMIEGDAKELSEADIVAAMRFAHEQVVKQVDAQIELRRKMGLGDKVVAETPADRTIFNAARELAGAELSEAYLIAGKAVRRASVKKIEDALKVKLLEKFPAITSEQLRATFDELGIAVVRENVLERGKRIDGRGADEVRPLLGKVGVLPRVHGSAFFARGETHALGTVTLGTNSDAQDMDAITGGPTSKSFMLHYNFPHYSVGETGRFGSPGRREIGHGNLAERSLAEVLPKDYPYTVRLVSDIMSSNGSSSMASICVGTLAMMDAGIPIVRPVAGISCGLFSAPGKARLVVDILGDEDHCGDMDFKVAGTRQGITGFQLDLKIRGLEWTLVEQAFEKCRVARMGILDYMQTVIDTPRTDLSPYAPRITVVTIPVDKIGELIGPGGKNIRRIVEISGAQIDINDDGTVKIFSSKEEGMTIAVREISLITAEPEEGTIYNGTVTGITKFGCFVEIFPGRDGLVHISELADCHVRTVEDVCKVGDQMWVKCIGVDEKGRVKLSRRAAMSEKDVATTAPA